MIEKSVEAEIKRLPSWEEDAELLPVDPDSMRWSASALRGRARSAEDRNDPMIMISVRWARVLSKMLDAGATATETPHG